MKYYFTIYRETGILFRNKVCTEWWSYENEPRNRTIHGCLREAHLFQFIPTIWQSSSRIPGQRQTLKSRNGIVATDSPLPVSSSSSSFPAVENKKTWGWLEAATTLAISFPSKLLLAAAAAAIAFNFNEKRIFKYRGSTRRLAATRANRGRVLEARHFFRRETSFLLRTRLNHSASWISKRAGEMRDPPRLPEK